MIKAMKIGENCESYGASWQSFCQGRTLIQIFQKYGYKHEVLFNHLFMCLCSLVDKGPECVAPLKCPEMKSRDSPLFLQVKALIHKALIKKENKQKTKPKPNPKPNTQKTQEGFEF